MWFGLLVLASVVAGLVGAVSGMGGGVILIPVLTAAGVDIKQAIGISLISVVALSCGTAISYVRGHLANLKISAFLELWAVIGALAGASITVVAARRPLFLLCGLTLLASWVLLWKQQDRVWQLVRSPAEGSRRLSLEGSYYDHVERRTVHYQARRPLMGGALMVVAGLVSGLLGIGASALTVLIHDTVLRLPPKVSAATSNLIIGVMALAGASLYLEAGFIDSKLLVPVILGVLLGASLGSRLLTHLTNRLVLQILFSILPVLGVELLINGLWSR